MMKMRNGGEAPGVSSKGTCQEGELVVNEMSDDHLDDIQGNSGVPGRVRRRSPREDTPWTYPALDSSGLSPVPNLTDEQPKSHCNGDRGQIE